MPDDTPTPTVENEGKEPAFFAAIPYMPHDFRYVEKTKAFLNGRKDRDGNPLEYAPGSVIIRQLDKVFPFGWGFTFDEPAQATMTDPASGEIRIGKGFVCRGKLVIFREAVDRAMGYDAGTTPRDLEYMDVGYNDAPMFETAYKGSITDALKRCARLLGDQFGNHLYDDSADAVIAAARSAASAKPQTPPAAPSQPAAPANPGFATIVVETTHEPRMLRCSHAHCLHQIDLAVSDFSMKNFRKELCIPCQNEEEKLLADANAALGTS